MGKHLNKVTITTTVDKELLDQLDQYIAAHSPDLGRQGRRGLQKTDVICQALRAFFDVNRKNQDSDQQD